MARPHFDTVDDYLAAQPPAVRQVLARVRAAIRRAVPDAEETISYQIPAYKVAGRAAIYFAGFKEHVSVYPIGKGLVEALGDEVRRRVAGKGTIRFPLSEPVPLQLIGRIARFRADETRVSAGSRRGNRQGPRP